MGLLPHLQALLLGHLGALIQFAVAAVAKAGDAVIVGLDAPALAVPELV